MSQFSFATANFDVDRFKEEEVLGALPGLTKVLRLHSAHEVEIFLAGEGHDAAVMGYFSLPQAEGDLSVFKEVSLHYSNASIGHSH